MQSMTASGWLPGGGAYEQSDCNIGQPLFCGPLCVDLAYNNRDGSALGIALDVNGEDFET